MRVIGIDPGSVATGYGVVECTHGRHRALEWGVVRTSKAPTFSARLRVIHEELTRVVSIHEPIFASVEDIFHARNVHSALKLGQARGAILLCMELADVPTFSYTPLEIKKALVGYGRASKEQVCDMVRLLLGLRDKDIPMDASDALAAALCHIQIYSTKQHIDLRRSPGG